MRRRALAAAVLLPLAACLGTTGNHIVAFRGAAAGPADAIAGGPMAFTNGFGWHVVLTKAVVHVGAMYLTQTLPSAGGGPQACILPETYVAQVITQDNGGRAGIDVDVLSPAPQYFPSEGQGTDLGAKGGQVWLTGANVDAQTDPTPVLDIEGTADKDGSSMPFVACFTISSNTRAETPTNAAEPGSNPICLQRIVSPVPVDLVPENGGTLLLRIDPRTLFVGVDFSALSASSVKPQPCPYDGPLPVATFANQSTNGDSTDPASTNLYSQLRATAPYRFSWLPPSR